MVERTAASTVTSEETKSEIVTFQLKARNSVKWTEETVDNEHMNKKKSKSKFKSPYL